MSFSSYGTHTHNTSCIILDRQERIYKHDKSLSVFYTRQDRLSSVMGLVKKLSVGGELVVTPIVSIEWACIKGSRRAAKCLNIVTILKLYSKFYKSLRRGK